MNYLINFFQVFHQSTNFEVCIKATEKSLREVKIWSKLSHKNIVDFQTAWFEYHENEFGFGLLTLYIQMELCDYSLKYAMMKLDEELNVHTQFLTPIGVFIRSQSIFQILQGINYLHSHDIPIIHRDLKLSNIVIKILPETFNVKICDFGLSTSHERKFINEEVVSQTHTECIGTLGIMAPEVVKEGGKYNEKSDIYCFGTMIFKIFNVEDYR
jgi:serine/threonine protein kinase